MTWPWRRGVAEAEQRLADADENTKGTTELAQRSRAADEQLREVMALNGFGKALQIAMRGRHA